MSESGGGNKERGRGTVTWEKCKRARSHKGEKLPRTPTGGAKVNGKKKRKSKVSRKAKRSSGKTRRVPGVGEKEEEGPTKGGKACQTVALTSEKREREHTHTYIHTYKYAQERQQTRSRNGEKESRGG